MDHYRDHNENLTSDAVTPRAKPYSTGVTPDRSAPSAPHRPSVQYLEDSQLETISRLVLQPTEEQEVLQPSEEGRIGVAFDRHNS